MQMTKRSVGTVGSGSENTKYILATAVKNAVMFLIGLFLSTGYIQGLAPFGVSFPGSVLVEYIPAASLGSAAGYLVSFGPGVQALRYISADLIASVISFFFKRNIKKSYHKHFSAVSVFIALCSTGIVMSLSITLSVDEIVLFAAEGAMGGVFAWFTDRFMNIDPVKKYAARLSGGETAAVLAVFAMLLICLKRFDTGLFSSASFAASLAVLIASTYGGSKYGSLFGISSGVVLGFTGTGSFAVGGMALGGLLSGIFSKQNRFLSSFIFTMTLCLTAFSADTTENVAAVIFGCIAAAVANMMLPKKMRKVFSDVFSLSDGGMFLSGQRKAFGMRLNAAADGLNDVTGCIKGVAGIYRRRSMPSEERIYGNTVNAVCKKCPKYENCWNINRADTYGWFTKIIESYKTDEELSENDMPFRFFTNCIEPEKVCVQLAKELGKYRAAMRETVKTGETVNIISDQFGAVSAFLANLAEAMESDEEYEADTSGMIRSVIEDDFGLTVESCGVFKNGEGMIFIELAFMQPSKRHDYSEITTAIEEITEKEFEEPEIRILEDGICLFTVCEKTKFHIRYTKHQISSKPGTKCGDTFDSFYDGKGRFYMILSDGMGTGKKAAADSVLCSALASKLLRSGFPVDGMLSMINSAMLLRSGEESLATLDIAVIDLYTGETEIYKAGASFSVIMKHGKMMKTDRPSLPVGILRDISFEKTELRLGENDSIVLMSDGVSTSALNMWKEMIPKIAGEPGFAEKLAKAARLTAENNSPDDITVLTATVL